MTERKKTKNHRYHK